MKLHFITSISKTYWNDTARFCIPTWKLPGKLTIYIDQNGGDLDWVVEIPFHKELLSVPELNNKELERSKVRKFWGKSWAQIDAIRNRSVDERVIWIDSDVEQIADVDETDFNFNFTEPFAMMNSGDHEDCWETGLVIFNQQYGKLNVVTRLYEKVWRDEEQLMGLFRPYDAHVLGHVAEERTFLNLCNQPCKNIDALANSRFGHLFKHWINKDNKKLLQEIKTSQQSENSSDIS